MGIIDSDIKQIISGSIAVRLGGALVTFLTQILLARILGASDFGTYSYVLSLIVTLTTVATFGMDTASVKYIAKFSLQNDWGRARYFITLTTLFAICLGIIIVFICWLILANTLDIVSAVPSHVMLLGLISIPILALVNIYGGAILGLGHPVLGQAPVMLLKPALVGLTFFVLFIIFQGVVSATSAILAEIISALFVVTVSFLLLLSKLPAGRTSNHNSVEWRSWFLTSSSLLVLALIQTLLSQTGTIVLGIFSKKIDVGIYAAVVRFTLPISLVLAGINAVAAPKLARLYASRNIEDLAMTVAWVARASTTIAIPIAIFLLLAGRPILNFLGPSFPSGYPILIILSIGQCVNAGAGCVLYLMTMTGFHIQAVRILGGIACLNILITIILVPNYGAIGAGISSASALISSNVILSLWIKRNLGINPTVLRNVLMRMRHLSS